MATPAENLKRFQEIAKRGLQDELPPEIKTRFDAAVERGLVELPQAAKPKAQPASRSDFMSQMNPIGDAVMTVGGGIAGTVAGGLTGLGTLAATGGDADAAMGVMNRTQKAFSHEPSTAVGKMALSKMGEGISAVDNIPKRFGSEKTIGEGWQAGRQTLGDATMEATGSPGAAALAYSAPDAALEALTFGMPKILSGAVKVGEKFKPAVSAMKDRGAALTDNPVKVVEPSWSEVEAAKSQINTKLAEWGDREIVGVGKDGMFSKDAIDIIRSVRGEPGAQWAANFNLFKEMGIEPTRVNITRGVDDYVAQADMAKKTGAVSDKIAAQSEGLQRNVGGRIDAFAAENFDTASTGEAIGTTLRNVLADMDAEVSAAYKSADTVAAGQPYLRLDGFMGAINRNRGSEAMSGGVISQVDGVVSNFGLMKNGMRINKNKRSAKNKGENASKIRVAEAYELRKQIGVDYDSASPAGKRVIRDLQTAIDNDIIKVAGEDTFAAAKAAKTAYHKAIGRDRVDRHDMSASKDSFLEDIISGKVQPERIIGKIASADKRDVTALKGFLIERSGPKAWDEVKASLLRDALEQATKNQTTLAGGVKDFKEATFVKYLANMGKDGKMQVIFNADEIAWINKIRKVGELRAPMVGVVNGSGPSGLAVETLGAKILSMADDKTFGLASKVTDHFLEGRRLKTIDGQAAASPRLSEAAKVPGLRGTKPQ